MLTSQMVSSLGGFGSKFRMHFYFPHRFRTKGKLLGLSQVWFLNHDLKST